MKKSVYVIMVDDKYVSCIYALRNKVGLVEDYKRAICTTKKSEVKYLFTLMRLVKPIKPKSIVRVKEIKE